jgi:hypothetical protein
MNDVFADYIFNYASFSLQPFSGDSGTSSKLLKRIINKLNDENDPIVISRFPKRKAGKRELVMISNKVEDQGTRCFGKIALIKKKIPLVWTGKDFVKEIERGENTEFIEVTNYAIHFCLDGNPIIMYEFNNEGPRFSDIDFYLKHISSIFKIAKNIKYTLHLDTDFGKLDKKVKNVFGVTVKVKSAYTNNYDWVDELKKLQEGTGYQDVRLQFFYGKVKDKTGNYKRNIKGTEFARNLINWLQKDKRNFKFLGDLKMNYQNIDDEVIDLDFLKNQSESLIKVPVINGIYVPREFKAFIAQEFEYYLRTGKTNNG